MLPRYKATHLGLVWVTWVQVSLDQGFLGPLGEGEYPAVREQGEQLHYFLCVSCACVAAYAAVQVALLAAHLLA